MKSKEALLEEIEKLKKENYQLKIKLNQSENELYLVRGEMEETSEKYLEMLTKLEDMVDDRTARLNSIILQQEQTQKALIESENRYKLLVNNASDGILLTYDGAIEFVNPIFINKSSFSLHEIIDSSLYKFFPDEEIEKVRNYIESIIPDENSHFIIETFLKTKDGTTIPVELNSVSFVTNYKKSILILVRDISFRKQVEEEKAILQRQKTALALAVTANHEINQPLMIGNANLEMLEMSFNEGDLSENQIKYINNIKDSLIRIQDILFKFKNSESITFSEYTEDVEMVVFREKEDE